MSRDSIDAICADLPGAEAAAGAWSVGGEAFARLGDGVSVRTGEAAMLVAAGLAEQGAGGWVRLDLDSPESELRRRVVASYEIARNSLPASVRARVDRTSG